MQIDQNSRNNLLQLSLRKVQFQILKYTVLGSLPNHFKNLLEQAIVYSSKTKELNFLHSRVNGLVLPSYVTEEQVRICSTFKTRPGDVFLITYPKAGTLWLSEIVYRITKPKKPSVNLLGGAVPYFETASHEELEALPSPRYIFTHLPLSLILRSNEHDLKYIYLARNPRDVAVSFFHFMSSVRVCDFEGTWDEFLDYFMNGEVPYGSYFDHVLEWWEHKDDENVLFLKYEVLKKELKGQVKIIAEFLGIQLSDEEANTIAEQCTFQAMKANPGIRADALSKMYKKGSHLRKGMVGDWQNYFSDEQLAEFQKLYQYRMQQSGLEFEFH